MCYIITSHHNCGHSQSRVATCFAAKRVGNQMCHMHYLPTWQHTELFPCPDCRTVRRAEAQELLNNKGRKITDAFTAKSENVQQIQSVPHSSGQSSVNNVQQDLNQGFHVGQNSTEDIHLQALVEALNAPPAVVQPVLQEWIPPSRRYAMVAGLPQQTQVYESSPTDSSEMPSAEGSSGLNSGVAIAYPNQTRPPSPPFMWMFRQ